MNHHATFKQFLERATHATRLTQGGQLQDATAAILAALGTAAAATPAPSRADDLQVIDVEAREIRPDHPPTAEPPPRAASPAGDFIAGSFAHSSAGTRAYKLYLPPGESDQARPMVVMLHGCTQNPDDFAAGTRMNEAARQQGFLVLYPEQTQHANAQRCWNWFKHNHQQRGRGEPALLAGMVREVMARHHVDPRRVFVAGLSAGGAMAAILGDTYPDLFAAVGVHSGLPTGAATDIGAALRAMSGGAPRRASSPPAPPTIVFHGDQDSTVHPSNGEQVVAGSAPGGSPPRRERGRSGRGRDYTRSVYPDAADGVQAEHWLVHGAGHAWSGGDARGSYTDGQGPDATAEMLRFFGEHPLRGAS